MFHPQLLILNLYRPLQLKSSNYLFSIKFINVKKEKVNKNENTADSIWSQKIDVESTPNMMYCNVSENFPKKSQDPVFKKLWSPTVTKLLLYSLLPSV